MCTVQNKLFHQRKLLLRRKSQSKNALHILTFLKVLANQFNVNTSLEYQFNYIIEFSFNIISRHSDVSIKGPDDLLISANVDEIMSRRALSKLKQCQTSDDVISAALWMPIGKLDRAFKSDYPVLGRNHTFGVPTIYKVTAH